MYLVFDIGGTFVKFAKITPAGEIVFKDKIPNKHNLISPSSAVMISASRLRTSISAMRMQPMAAQGMEKPGAGS